MAEQQMTGGQGYAPLRVQRTFQALDDGRGGRAAALAGALGVALDALPKVAKIGGDNAFREGMQARIDGVKRENANTTNKSMLGFMFSNRAQDGFDYQDAQLELPMLQSEELLDMEARLRESRNPADFRAYMAERDQVVRQRLEGKSDIYRYTIADSLMKTRAEQAGLFTQWVQSNRSKDRAAAAAAAAKAAAQAKAARLEALELTMSGVARGTFDASVGIPEGTPDGLRNVLLSLSSKSVPEQIQVSSVVTGGAPAATGTAGGTAEAPDVVGGGLSFGSAQSGSQAAPSESAGEPEFDLGQVVQQVYGTPESIGRDSFSEFVTTASERFGVPPSEAKDSYLSAMILEADRRNDERILDNIPVEYLDHNQQKALYQAQDTIRKERLAMVKTEADAAKAQEEIRTKALEEQAASKEVIWTVGLAEGLLTPQDIMKEMMDDPYFRRDGEERNKVMNRILDTRGNLTDPAMEATVMAEFDQLVIDSYITGNPKVLLEALPRALSQVNSPALRTKIIENFTGAEELATNMIFEGSEPYYANITQAFPSGVGQQETAVDLLMGTTGKTYFDSTVDTAVRQDFETLYIDMIRDWQIANPQSRISRSIKMTLMQQASVAAIERGKALYGIDNLDASVTTPDDALTRLNNIGN